MFQNRSSFLSKSIKDDCLTVFLSFAALFPFWKKYIRNSLADIAHTVRTK